MVRQIKVVDVCSYEEEEVVDTHDDDDDDDYDEIVEEAKPDLAEFEHRASLKEARESQVEARESQVELRTPKKKKQLLDMPTTNKIIEQVQCLSCGKSMSAKTLKYSHAKYCTERNVEPQPEEIPVPQIEMKNTPTRKTLPVKRAKAKAKAKETEKYDADEVSSASRLNLDFVKVAPQPPPPPSREKAIKLESPDQFWNNTVKNMKEKKMQQYKNLCSNAF